MMGMDADRSPDSVLVLRQADRSPAAFRIYAWDDERRHAPAAGTTQNFSSVTIELSGG
jgi:hypothetical protein